MPSRVRPFLAGVLTVLAVAAAVLLVRDAFQRGPQDVITQGLPASRIAPQSSFSLGKGESRAVPKDATLIATARHAKIGVHTRVGGRITRILHQRIFEKQRIPLTFLVTDHRKGWVHVELPTRPNLAKGWLRRHDVDLTYTRYSLRVELAKHDLLVFDGGKLVRRTKVGVGQSVSPTPGGRYFVTDKVKAIHPEGFFGPYALGLSAHSNVYTSFEGGDGQIGIHGTNLPKAIGTDVSHGCVRIDNRTITALAKTLPLGTPVTIVAPPSPKVLAARTAAAAKRAAAAKVRAAARKAAAAKRAAVRKAGTAKQRAALRATAVKRAAAAKAKVAAAKAAAAKRAATLASALAGATSRQTAAEHAARTSRTQAGSARQAAAAARRKAARDAKAAATARRHAASLRRKLAAAKKAAR